MLIVICYTYKEEEKKAHLVGVAEVVKDHVYQKYIFSLDESKIKYGFTNLNMHRPHITFPMVAIRGQVDNIRLQDSSCNQGHNGQRTNSPECHHIAFLHRVKSDPLLRRQVFARKYFVLLYITSKYITFICSYLACRGCDVLNPMTVFKFNFKRFQ